MIPLDMDGVDDIFKSFVCTKLKQFGINGVKNAEEKLEESLKKSLTETNKTNKIKDSNSNDKPKKDKKHKHKKKKKKHKEEKKKSKKDKENKESNEKVLVRGKRKSEERLDQPIKKKLIVDEDENVIKDKTLNCYHDTVIKIKEIENLSATLQVEPEDTSEVGVAEAVKEDVFVMEEAVQITQNEPDLSCNKLPEEIPSSNQTETEKPEKVPDAPTQDNQVQKCDPGLVQTQGFKTESTLTTTLKEIKSMANMAAEALPKTESPTAPAKSPESKHVTLHKHSHESSRHSRKHSSRHHSRTLRSRSRSHSKKRSHRSKRSRSRSRSRHRHSRHHHSRSGDHKRKHRRHHRRSRSLSPIITKEDKVKLLAIAKANVMAQHKADLTINNLSLESKALLRSGGFTVQQLTGVCKDIADGKREVNVSPSVVQPTPPASIHHPYQVKPTPAISFNIKSNPIVRSTKPINELTKEFPVSSGSQHQKEEVYGKWEPVEKEKPKEKEEKTSTVCPEPQAVEESNAVLIQNVIAERVHAARQLESNPSDESAKRKIADSQQKLNSWTNALKMPGRFTGSSSLQPLSRSELERGQAAWATTQTFNSTKQVEGIGKSLLQKMGWRDGESLGKTNIGLLEPLKVSVKTDRKGLSSFMEAPAPPSMPTHKTVVKDLSGKHPVSALMELCTKRRWSAPDFRLVLDSGPDHSRQFLFKVTVNNTAYQPSEAAMNKKIAKAQAAEAALQAMGLLQS